MTGDAKQDAPTAPASTAAIRDALNEDIGACWAALQHEDSQTNRRNFVRAAFAFVEGFLSIMKYGALAEHEAGRCKLTRGEVALILEEGYEVTEDGTVRTRPVFVPAKANVRFAFEVFSRAHGVTACPDYSDQGWQSFQQALQVRNRITHPKASGDLNISDGDLAVVEEAHLWFLRASFEINSEGRANLIAKLKAAGIPLPKLELP